MAKYVIVWNAGYGDSAEVQEHETQEEASLAAYERWREEAENAADYSARPLTAELAREYDLADEDAE